MKKIILTADYELFLGSRTGSVEKCMIEPAYNLAEILGINNSKMTVFWDILHYYRLRELEKVYLEIENDRILIDKQISFLVSNGHDVQLHLHPHWLDARYEKGEWKFIYDRFKLHSLSDEDNPEKINTISGCITVSKNLMKQEIRKYIPGYNVNTFRAGGYLIEPFEKLKGILKRNNIYMDSSVLPGLYNENPVNGYNFRNYPNRNFYRFTNSPSEISEDGEFTEIPITTISIPIPKNIFFTLLRRLKYPGLESGRMGTGSGESAVKNKKSNLKKIISLLTAPKLAAFTTDGNFQEQFNFMCRKAGNNSVMILHPKLLNQHTLNLLREKLVNNDIKFISINNYLKSVE